jgi:hypothetical protein
VYRVIAWNEGGESFSDSLTVPGVLLARVTLASSPNPQTWGSTVRLTVSVAASSGAVVPTGSAVVTATNPGYPAITWTAPLQVANGAARAIIDTTALKAGTNTITAAYGGDAKFLAASSQPLTQVITKVPTVTWLRTNKTPTAFGETVAITALVRGGYGGSVVFFVDGAEASTVPLASYGQALFTTRGLSVGSHTVTATYSGSPEVLASKASGIAQVVVKSSTRAAVVASASSVSLGAPVQLTATVSAVSPGSGVPTGTVTFKGDNGVIVAAGVPVGPNGQAVVSTTSLARGTRQITAVYSGSGSYNASTSSTISVIIR